MRSLVKTVPFVTAVAGFALAALVGVFAPSDAAAQAFNVRAFSCTTTESGAQIDVDIRGIGNTDICVSGTVTSSQNCACVSSSGSCPQATNKASLSSSSTVSAVLEPKNGNVRGTVPVDLTVSETCGIEPTQCGAGQTVTLISHSTTGPIQACTSFEFDEDNNCVCTGGVIANTTCSESDVDFAGRRNSCIKLF